MRFSISYIGCELTGAGKLRVNDVEGAAGVQAKARRVEHPVNRQGANCAKNLAKEQEVKAFAHAE